MDIKTFLMSPTPSLSDYPLEEVEKAIRSEEDERTFIDDIGDRVVSALALVEKHKLANAPIDKVASEMHSIVSNIMAFEVERHDPEGRIRVLSNILNSAKLLNDIAAGIENAVKNLRKKKAS